MIRLLIPVICSFISFNVCSQTGYNILYSSKAEDVPPFMNTSVNKLDGYSRLVFNDSVSYYYFFPYRKDPMKESKEYGSKVFHHSHMRNLSTQLSYGGVAYQLPEKKRYYISNPLSDNEWTYQDTTKIVSGYHCKKAFRTKTNWVQVGADFKSYVDSTIAWYTEQIRLPFGPMTYYGLPGVVLEVYEQRLMGRHIIAEKIQAEPVSILIPSIIDIIPLSEHGHGKRRK